MKIYLPLKRLALWGALIIGSLAASEAHARKLNLKFGYFNVAAKTSQKSGNLSSLGSYQVSVNQDITDRLEANIGYTLLMSKIVGGDLGFGLDIGLNYFPLTRLSPQKTEVTGASVYINELWRPYVGVGFTERRFQSVEANYAGFSVTFGTERQLEYNNYSLILELKLSSFTGTGNSQADEQSLLSGISIPF